jgi:diguanylate cyclase (GGDEF)-like protein
MTRGREAGLWVYIVAVALVGAAVHGRFVMPLAEGEQLSWAWLVAVTAGFFAAERWVVHLRLGREAFAFSMMELPLVLGLFFVRPDLLVVARLTGSLVAWLWQRKAAQKMVFNAGLFTLETSVAVLIWYAVVGVADPVGPIGWLATGLAVLTTSILSSTLVSGVIAIASGEMPRSFGEVFSLGQVGDLANACFALVAVYIFTADWRAGWMLAVVFGVLAVAYRSVEGARSRSDSLEQVSRFTERVGRDVDVDAVVGSILAEVRAAFEVETVQLRLSRLLEPDEDWSLSDGVLERRRSTLVDRLAPRTRGGTLLVTRGTRTAPFVDVLRDEGVREVLMVPLRSVGQVSGYVLVADRVSDVAPLTASDVSHLQSFANHAAVALENAVRADLIIKQAEEREHEAMHDELTGLANRRLFVRRLGDELAGGPVAVLLLDLDRFKEVNDTLGHEVGDRLLRVAAERVAATAPRGSLVSRLGGDEFAVLLPGADEQAARVCATQLREVLARPMVLGGFSVAVDASVGLAVAEHGTDAVTAMRWTDLAMNAAKQTRVGLEVYRPELDQADSTRLGLLADLRDAVANETLEVYYQPKVDLRSGKVVGVEALARWHHPELGVIGPDEFIPLAEHSTLITPLTMMVLRRALAEGERWKALTGSFSVAVNISPRSLLDPLFVDEVTRALARVELPASALTLEITETNLMSDPEQAILALERLHDVGVRLSVDDLGTGYSSLAYLQRLPVDEIKIDRSFLHSFEQPSAQAVVGTIVDLGHRLGKHVVAEGVEVLESMETLRRLGCDTAQGYWIARPMPAADLTQFLEGKPPAAAPSLRLVQ